MARGLSQAIAPSTSASDSAGSHARTRRAGTARTCPGRRATAGAALELASASIAERGLDDFLLRHFAALEVRDDPAVAQDIDVIAVLELIGLGGVPEEGPAASRLFAQQIVDLELGAYVDAAHRIVHQDDAGVGPERAREQGLLLVSTRQRENVVVQARRANAHSLLPEPA